MRRRPRATALLVTGLLTAGVGGAAVGFAPFASAEEGRSTPSLAAFYRQKVTWAPCKLEEHEDPEEWKDASCATVIVPLDYRNPTAGRLSIAVSRVKAKNPAKRQGVLLLNPGGPSGEGLSLPLEIKQFDLANTYDLIGFDPRGVHRSTELVCEVTKPAPESGHTRPTDAEFPAIVADAKRRERACQRAGGGIRPFISTANTARDMDVIRGVLGEQKINYLGFSYGTYLGAVYGSLFPAKLNRSVLDSAMHPDWLYYEQSKQVSVAAKQNVDAWIPWVAARNKTYGFGKTPAQVRANIETLGRKLAAKPVRLPSPVPPGFPDRLDRNFFDQFLGQTARYRESWDFLSEMVQEIRRAATKPAATLPPDASTALGLMTKWGITETSNGVYQAVTCEADWPRNLQTYYTQMRKFRTQYPYGPGAIAAMPTECAFRAFTPPEKLVTLQRKGYPTGLVIQSEGDGNTQYDGGPAMASRLRHNLISVPDDGQHGLYGRNECVTKRVDDYLISGVLPSSRSVCPGVPRADVPADDEAPPPSKSLTKRSLQAQARELIAERSPVWDS